MGYKYLCTGTVPKVRPSTCSRASCRETDKQRCWDKSSTFYSILFLSKGFEFSSFPSFRGKLWLSKHDLVRLLLSHLMHSARRSRHSDGQRLRPKTIAGSAWRGSLRERSAVGERVSDVKDGEYRLGITGL